MSRAVGRTRRLAFQQAIGHLTRVDTRLLLLLWHLADRWGHVDRDGVLLPLRLTHQTLGRLVGARRPSVTTALNQLAAQDLIRRRADGSWLLLGDALDDLEELERRHGRAGDHRRLRQPALAG
jgi:CRP-like cAMP-binding protein